MYYWRVLDESGSKLGGKLNRWFLTSSSQLSTKQRYLPSFWKTVSDISFNLYINIPYDSLSSGMVAINVARMLQRSMKDSKVRNTMLRFIGAFLLDNIHFDARSTRSRYYQCNARESDAEKLSKAWG